MIAACKDECTANMSDIVKEWFTHMGSLEIDNLQHRCAYYYVGISKGGGPKNVEIQVEKKAW